MKYLIIDLEATCCNDESFPKSEMETIQIGAVVADEKGQVLDRIRTFIRPVRHPELTQFCTELTGITQNLVKWGQSFRNVIGAFPIYLKRCHPELLTEDGSVIWYSWGKFDKVQLAQGCIYHDIKNPFYSHHKDLSRIFRRKYGYARGGLGAVKKMGLSLEGKAHDGLCDALNYAKLIPFLFP